MLALAGLSLFSLGTLVASASRLGFNFTDVQQCEQIKISFKGSDPLDGVPSSISVIPFNSTAIFIPLPNPNIITTGVALTFLPFPVGTNFIASMDDAAGNNLVRVSDVIRIQPSSANRTDCLPTLGSVSPRRFQLASPVSQCETFTVNYDTTLIKEAPNVRLYSPKGSAFLLNITSDDPVAGRATYMMNFARGKEIVLLIDDGGSIRESTPLISVQGDSASSKSCFTRKNSEDDKDKSDEDREPASPVSSRAAIIGGASGGGAVALVGVCMAVFIIRDRRRRRTHVQIDFDPSMMEKGSNEKFDPPPPRPVRTPSTLNPLYTTPSFFSPTKPKHESMESWLQVESEEKRPELLESPLSPSQLVSGSPRSVDSISLRDIEGMLNLAVMQTEHQNRNDSSILLYSTVPAAQPIAVPEPVVPRFKGTDRYTRNPDVPSDLHSRSFSGYSLNPFDNRNSVAGSIHSSPAHMRQGSSGSVRPSPLRSPTSPRSRLRTEGFAAPSPISEQSGSWYVVAR